MEVVPGRLITPLSSSSFPFHAAQDDDKRFALKTRKEGKKEGRKEGKKEGKKLTHKGKKRGRKEEQGISDVLHVRTHR